MADGHQMPLLRSLDFLGYFFYKDASPTDFIPPKKNRRQPWRIGGVDFRHPVYVARLLMGPAQSPVPAAPLACTRNQYSVPLVRPGMVQLDFLPT